MQTKQSGFTLIELLLVIGIVSGLTAVVLPAYRDYQIRSDLNIAAEHVSQALNRARILAENRSRSVPWGYSVSHQSLFAGASYQDRDLSSVEAYPFSATVEASGLDEVIFAPLTGSPSQTGTILLRSLRGDERTVGIFIGKEGIPIQLQDRLNICHCNANPPHTLSIPEAAWPAHRRHGDYLGQCTMQNTCK